MKVSRAFRLMMISATMLGMSAFANAAFYDLGTIILPDTTGNASPGPTVTNGDSFTLKGVWLPATDTSGGSGPCAPCTTEWYFNTTIPGLFLDNAAIAHNGFTGFSADLYDPGSVFITTFVPGVTQYLVPLALTGTYKLVVSVTESGTAQRSYTFDANVIPLPAAAWLLLSGVAGLGALARRRKVAAEA
ncbi:MAG: VPLPA-CTERM sorting domain-containing protein [Gammaproteobacteria bacterium]|nr:VPLPA-CTERM sorting domain-containing protein [Gammaproteobacteria bacterium]